jgi:hypothetical protein
VEARARPLIPDHPLVDVQHPGVDLPLRLPRRCSSLPLRGDSALLDPNCQAKGDSLFLGVATTWWSWGTAQGGVSPHWGDPSYGSNLSPAHPAPYPGGASGRWGTDQRRHPTPAGARGPSVPSPVPSLGATPVTPGSATTRGRRARSTGQGPPAPRVGFPMPESARSCSTDWAQGPRRRLRRLPNARAWGSRCQGSARALLRVGDRQERRAQRSQEGLWLL